MGVDGRVFSVGSFTESTLTALLGLVAADGIDKQTKYRRVLNTQQHRHKAYGNTRTAGISSRLASEQDPHIREGSPASVDPGYAEIGPVQLSQYMADLKHDCWNMQETSQTDRRTQEWILHANRFATILPHRGKNMDHF